MKIRCPHGHLAAEITREASGWMIEIPADKWMMLSDSGRVTTTSRYPQSEPLNARPERILACPRECMLESSWYRAESAELERHAAAGSSNYRLTR